jgi:hypothetical protein
MVDKTKTGVVKSGSYGDATLKTPGTPIDQNGTSKTKTSGKTKSNGVLCGPSGVTFQAGDHPAPHGFNATSAAREALGNLGGKSKVITSKSGKSFRQGKGNTGTSAAGAPLAVKTHY